MTTESLEAPVTYPAAAAPAHDTVAAGVPAFPAVSERVRDLHARMTLEEKLAQVVGYWVDQGGTVAPMQGEMAAPGGAEHFAEATRHGIGHLTRVYGTRPVEPAERVAWLWAQQRRLKHETRLGIPALVHEECLTGLAAWRAAVFPTPLAWGATFDPAAVEEAARAIGASMRLLGVHQGLAPVLDVIRDVRWGRVDECIAEDPYLVATIGTAYVRGLQGAGIDATLKHFVGYSASAAGRNHAPVSLGPREIAETFLPPFRMALTAGKAASVMNAYTALDGVPMAASGAYLTDLLRGVWGFDGVVVADYFSVAFLEVTQRIAADRGAAAALALTAGIDVELPDGDAYLEPLARRIRSGELDERYLDRAVLRVLAQKERFGLLDDGAFDEEPPESIDLDSARHRALATRLARESLILLANDGLLPLSPALRAGGRIAVIGPNADRTQALQGCYSFANHVLPRHPEVPLGLEIPTVLEALRAAVGPGCRVATAPGCTVEGDDESGFAAASALAAASDVAVVVVGDQAGLFGRGTVGEGNDAESLELPGAQRRLVEAVAATGTPVVLVVISGRPYALGWALDGPGPRPAAVLQAFFPGEAGGAALADVLLGDAAPSGRLPVSLPRSAGAQPYGYRHPLLGGTSEVSAAGTAPVRPFGFGLTYTTVEYGPTRADESCPTDGLFHAEVTVENSGGRACDEVVQLYGRDVWGSVPRPVEQLLGYARVTLAAGQRCRVRFAVPAARLAFPDRRLVRVVEPGEVEVWAAAHAGIRGDRALVRFTGALCEVPERQEPCVTAELAYEPAMPGHRPSRPENGTRP